MQKPVLYLMLGYPGSGKTTTAIAVAEVTGAVHLWADHIRREIFTKPTYSHVENIQLYDELNRRTAELLKEGKSIVFDTSFNYFKDREHLREIAAHYDAETVLLWVKTPKELAHDRATADAHAQPTRALGNMASEDFHRLSDKLEEPTIDEPYITIDGTQVTPDYIRKHLKH